MFRFATLLTEAFNVMRDYPGSAFVLVDDGSSDQTLDVAVRTARALKGQLIPVRHAQSVGQSVVLATGISKAKGDLIVTMDGDGHRFIPALVRSIGGETAIVEVNHRPRTAGLSKYNAWNRTRAGIRDLFGVLWLRHRTCAPNIASPIIAKPIDAKTRPSVTERA
jgi:glycosyltransferase involved in cell wall biosynthesis